MVEIDGERRFFASRSKARAWAQAENRHPSNRDLQRYGPYAGGACTGYARVIDLGHDPREALREISGPTMEEILDEQAEEDEHLAALEDQRAESERQQALMSAYLAAEGGAR